MPKPALSPNFWGDDRGLRALVHDYGAEDTVSNVFTGCCVEVLDDGGPRSLPETWSYFRPSLDDERKKARMSEEGLRPGDVANWREQPVH